MRSKNIETIKIKSEFFNPKDTLTCGQVFRYKPFKNGYLVFSLDKCCYLYEKEGFTFVESNEIDYFENYFDLKRDYSLIFDRVKSYNNSFLEKAAGLGKGIRIIKQNACETAFSFIISQNNNIGRITSIIENLCSTLGEKREFMGEVYYTFPKISAFSNQSVDFYKKLGLGYRSEYFYDFSKLLDSGYDFFGLNNLDTISLEKELLKIRGIGKKVANCIMLFGFNRSDSFPVDTWIEKVYKENLNGKLTNREKISSELVYKFKDLSGYIQQYVFYYKRSLENK